MVRTRRAALARSGNGFPEKDHLMNTARINLLRFLCASGLIIVLAAALNFVVDPLQLFRPAVYDFSAYALPRLTQFPNVTFHDFRVAGEITHDLNNYGDVLHH